MCSLGEVILARPWCALSIFWAETVFPLTEVTSKGSLEVCLVPSEVNDLARSDGGRLMWLGPPWVSRLCNRLALASSLSHLLKSFVFQVQVLSSVLITGEMELACRETVASDPVIEAGDGDAELARGDLVAIRLQFPQFFLKLPHLLVDGAVGVPVAMITKY